VNPISQCYLVAQKGLSGLVYIYMYIPFLERNSKRFSYLPKRYTRVHVRYTFKLVGLNLDWSWFRRQNGRFDDCVVKLSYLVIHMACQICKIELLSCVDSDIRGNYWSELQIYYFVLCVYQDNVFIYYTFFLSGQISQIMFAFP